MLQGRIIEMACLSRGVRDWGLKLFVLSLGGNLGRLCFWIRLLKPSYFMSLFKVPIKLSKLIQKLMRDFLWEGCGKGNKIT